VVAPRALNGAGGDQAAAALAELKRRRALDVVRNQRYRDRQKQLLQGVQGAPRVQGASAPGGPVPQQRAGAGPPHIHETRPLAELGAEDYRRTAPHVDAVPIEPTATDHDGAKKFAAIVALLFRMSLEDASKRYDLGRLAGELGAELAADELDVAKRAAVTFVFEHAERCALKHGIGLTVPFEDELVTLGAGAGSAVYLLARLTGRLGQPAGTQHPSQAARPAGPSGPPTDDDEVDSAWGPIRVDQGA
jgi:hypothetical protein